MDDKRAETLDALQVFIQTQKALLTRTNLDIERLQKLKSHVLEEPSSFVNNLSQELDSSSFRLSDQVDCQLSLPKSFHWSVFEARDPAALHALTLSTRQAYLRQHEIPTTQRSELSDLQKLVKQARRTIIDPVLSSIGYISEPEVESDEDIDPEELRREREREKIRELKKRKIQASGLSLPSSMRARGPSGVFIRHDVDDESMEVDISLGEQTGNESGGAILPILIDTPGNISTPLAASPPPSPSKPGPPRKPTVKAKAKPKPKPKPAKDADASQPPRKKAKKSTDVVDESDIEARGTSEKPSRDSGKPKPETYKQAWSVEEQHLLEQLLEQIPDGEKFRWQKISRAMDGKRTPRQVASRVQKYFEKLKRFGIGVDGAGPS